jgi:phenylacetate-CoA ligase
MEPIIIERWLHDIIRRKLQEDNEFRKWMRREELPTVTRDDVDRYHVYLFRKTLAYASLNSAFYKNQLKKTGITANDINSLADIHKVPFTTPEDIAENPYYFACVSLGSVSRITTFASSGTTGPQKKVFVTDKDLQTMTDFMAIGMKTVAKAGDKVQIMLPGGLPNGQSELLGEGVRKMGGVPVITGNKPGPEEQLKIIDKEQPQVLFGETAYLWRITKETCQYHDLKAKGVQTIFLTSEHLSEASREQLKQIWGCAVHVHYGMTEMGLGVSVECGAHDGYHYNEADLMVEIIDPVTGETAADGTEGEVVFSTLNREAMPLLRYRTHDISRMISQPCPCGASTMQRIAPVTRRHEAIIRISGGELYPSLFDEMLFSIPEIIDYQATVIREKSKDTLALRIETESGTDDLKQAIREKLKNLPAIKPNLENGRLALSPIETVGRGTFTRLSRAKKLIIEIPHT